MWTLILSRRGCDEIQHVVHMEDEKGKPNKNVQRKPFSTRGVSR